MVFMGRGFTSGGQKSVSGFSAAIDSGSMVQLRAKYRLVSATSSPYH